MEGFTYQNQNGYYNYAYNSYGYPYPYEYRSNSGCTYYSQPLQSMPLYTVSGADYQFFQRDMPTVSWMCSCPACLVSIRQFLDSLGSTYGLCANISGNGPAFEELMANALKAGQVVLNANGTYDLAMPPSPIAGEKDIGPDGDQMKAKSAEGEFVPLSHENNCVNGKLEDNKGGVIEKSAETMGKGENPTADETDAHAVDKVKIEDDLTLSPENSAESNAEKEGQELLGAASTNNESSDLKDETLDKFPVTPDGPKYDSPRKWKRFGDQGRRSYTPRSKYGGGERYGSENNFNNPALLGEVPSVPFYDLFWTFYCMSLMGYGNLNLYNNIANNYNGWHFNTNGASSSAASTSSSTKDPDPSTRSRPPSSSEE